MLDLVGVIIFVICIFTYAIVLLWGLHNPTKSRRGRINEIYIHFVETRLNPNETPTIVIQVMRNLIMANSIFISALLVLLGMLASFYQVIFSNEPLIGGLEITITLGFAQVTLMGGVLAFSLINFILAIRLIVRFTLLATTDVKYFENDFNSKYGKQFVINTFISAQNHWLFALRGLFFLLPLLTWLINSIFFILGTIGVTIALIVFEDIGRISVQRNNFKANL